MNRLLAHQTQIRDKVVLNYALVLEKVLSKFENQYKRCPFVHERDILENLITHVDLLEGKPEPMQYAAEEDANALWSERGARPANQTVPGALVTALYIPRRNLGDLYEEWATTVLSVATKRLGAFSSDYFAARFEKEPWPRFDIVNNANKEGPQIRPAMTREESVSRATEDPRWDVYFARPLYVAPKFATNTAQDLYAVEKPMRHLSDAKHKANVFLDDSKVWQTLETASFIT